MATNETVDIDLNVKTNLPGTIADLKQMKKELKTIKDDDTFKKKQQEIDDLEDALRGAKTGAGNFAEVLGTIPGPLGAIGSQVGGTLQSLKQFGALKFSDIKGSFVELGKDVIDAGKGIAKLTGLTKVYSIANNALSKSFFGVAAGETAAATAAGILTAALAATGITLLIGAVALLVEAYKDWAGGAEKAAEAQKQLNERTQKGIDAATAATLAFNKSQEEISVKRAQVERKSEADIQKIREEAAKDRIRIAKENLAKLQAIQGADTTAAADAVMTAQDDLTKIQLDGQIARNTKSDALTKTQREKDKQNLETINKNEKAAALSLLDDREQTKRKIVNDYNEQIKLAAANGAETVILEEAKLKALGELKDKYQKEDTEKAIAGKVQEYENLITDIDFQNQLLDDDFQADLQRLANKEAYLAEQKTLELSNTKLTLDERNAIIQKYAEKERQIDKDTTTIKKAELQARTDLQLQYADVVGQFGAVLSQAAGENKSLAIAGLVIEQAAGVAKIIINTQAAASKAGYLTAKGIATLIAGGLGVASAVIATKKGIDQINKVNVPGGGGNAGASTPPPTYGGALTMATPQITGTEATTPGSQIAQTIAASSGKPVRAYVVSSDISSQQALDRKTNRGATFGQG